MNKHDVLEAFKNDVLSRKASTNRSLILLVIKLLSSMILTRIGVVTSRVKCLLQRRSSRHDLQAEAFDPADIGVLGTERDHVSPSLVFLYLGNSCIEPQVLKGMLRKSGGRPGRLIDVLPRHSDLQLNIKMIVSALWLLIRLRLPINTMPFALRFFAAYNLESLRIDLQEVEAIIVSSPRNAYLTGALYYLLAKEQCKVVALSRFLTVEPQSWVGEAYDKIVAPSEASGAAFFKISDNKCESTIRQPLVATKALYLVEAKIRFALWPSFDHARTGHANDTVVWVGQPALGSVERSAFKNLMSVSGDRRILYLSRRDRVVSAELELLLTENAVSVIHKLEAAESGASFVGIHSNLLCVLKVGGFKVISVLELLRKDTPEKPTAVNHLRSYGIKTPMSLDELILDMDGDAGGYRGEREIDLELSKEYSNLVAAI